MGRTRDVSKILTSNTSILTLASASATYAPIASGGLVLMKPTSVVNGTDNGTGTISFTSQTSISLNGIFTSSYRNYRIVLDVTAISAVDSIIGLRMRTAAGSDDTSANYVSISQFLNQTGGSGSFSTTSGTLAYLANTDGGGGNQGHYYGAVLDILNPRGSVPTILIRQGMGIQQDSTTYQAYIGNILHNVSTSYDSITLLTSSTTTLTGQIQVFGYKE